MLNNKKILIIVGILVVVAAVILIGWMIFSGGQTVEVTPEAGVELPKGAQLPSEAETGLPEAGTRKSELTAEEQDRAAITNTVKFFVGMLGTYSPDAKFQNIADLKSMMTNKMTGWADEFIRNNLPNIENQSESVTTTVLKTEILSYSSQGAKVLANTRREKINQEGQKLISQEVEVELIKISGKWLVDKVAWK